MFYFHRFISGISNIFLFNGSKGMELSENFIDNIDPVMLNEILELAGI